MILIVHFGDQSSDKKKCRPVLSLWGRGLRVHEGGPGRIQVFTRAALEYVSKIFRYA